MPLKLDLSNVTDSISLDECHELLVESKFDPEDNMSFVSVAPILKKLNNNKEFLSEFLICELEQHCSNQDVANGYTPQVIMLKAAQKNVNFFIRANIWLGKSEPLLKTSGEKSFFYNVPHDHNFSFLTSGYLGPGYSSDYYEYEYDQVVGYPGERVDLTFTGRHCLAEDEVMLYRACKDIHNQLPAQSLSVSLNVMPASKFSHLKPQYMFDEKCQHIIATSATTDSSQEPFYHLIAEVCGEQGRSLLEEVALSSTVIPDRVKALKALVASTADEENKLKTLEKYGFNSDQRLLREHSQVIKDFCQL